MPPTIENIKLNMTPAVATQWAALEERIRRAREARTQLPADAGGADANTSRQLPK